MKVLGANGLQYLITKLMGVDFIVEEGTSGIWTYRKWNSGKIELWGDASGSVTAYGNYSYGYNYYMTVSFPFTLNSVINYQASAQLASQITITSLVKEGVTMSSMQVYASCPQGGTQPIYAKIYVLGTWK